MRKLGSLLFGSGVDVVSTSSSTRSSETHTFTSSFYDDCVSSHVDSLKNTSVFFQANTFCQGIGCLNPFCNHPLVDDKKEISAAAQRIAPKRQTLSQGQNYDTLSSFSQNDKMSHFEEISGEGKINGPSVDPTTVINIPTPHTSLETDTTCGCQCTTSAQGDVSTSWSSISIETPSYAQLVQSFTRPRTAAGEIHHSAINRHSLGRGALLDNQNIISDKSASAGGDEFHETPNYYHRLAVSPTHALKDHSVMTSEGSLCLPPHSIPPHNVPSSGPLTVSTATLVTTVT